MAFIHLAVNAMTPEDANKEEKTEKSDSDGHSDYPGSVGLTDDSLTSCDSDDDDFDEDDDDDDLHAMESSEDGDGELGDEEKPRDDVSFSLLTRFVFTCSKLLYLS